MTTPSSGVYIENLPAFRAALRKAEDYAPRELTAALKSPGEHLVTRFESRVPIGSRPDDPHHGLLRSSYKPSVRGSTGNIVSSVPYAGGAEWGAGGKWAGFNKYGPPGRFAARQIDTDADLILNEIADGLTNIFTIYGWAEP